MAWLMTRPWIHVLSGTILGYNSKLMAVVYDPKNEPSSKLPGALPPQNPPRDTRKPSPSPGPAPVPTPRYDILELLTLKNPSYTS